jgi:hypothetical protein
VFLGFITDMYNYIFFLQNIGKVRIVMYDVDDIMSIIANILYILARLRGVNQERSLDEYLGLQSFTNLKRIDTKNPVF